MVRHGRIGQVFVMAALTLTLLVGLQGSPARAQSPGHSHSGTSGAAATPDQQAAATQLLARVKTATARYARLEAAEADGYRQSGPFRFVTWGPAHFANPRFLRDDRILDLEHPEGLVYLRLQNGQTVLLGAFFKAPKGMGPTPGGALTEWHSHECLTGNGRALRSEDGQCPAGTTLRPARMEMLHVWTFDNPDGPFAHGLTRRGIEAAVAQFSTR